MSVRKASRSPTQSKTYLPNTVSYCGDLTQQLLPNSRKQRQWRPVRLQNTRNIAMLGQLTSTKELQYSSLLTQQGIPANLRATCCIAQKVYVSMATSVIDTQSKTMHKNSTGHAKGPLSVPCHSAPILAAQPAQQASGAASCWQTQDSPTCQHPSETWSCWTPVKSGEHLCMHNQVQEVRDVTLRLSLTC